MNKKLSTSLVASFLLATNLLSNELDQITVTSATKSEQSIKDVTSNVEVITKEDIEERHFTTVTEALNTITGINIVSNGGIGSTSTLYLRGTSNNRTLILIDGIKYKDHSSISGTDISSIMISDIEKIEIIKGAQSGIWGADAAAGVINIITSKNKKDGISLKTLVEIGSFNTKKLNGQIAYKNKNIDLKFNAQRITSDSFTTKATANTDIDAYEDDYYENTTLNLQGNYFISDSTKLNFNITNIDSLKDYDSSGPDDVTMKNDSKSNIYSLAINQNYKNHNITLKYENSNIKRDQIGTTYGVKKTDSTSDNIELIDNISYNKKDLLLIGAGFSKDKMDYVKADTTKNSASNKTKFAYLTNSNSFDNLVFTQSLRYDSFNNFSDKSTGKVGVKYNLNKDLSFSSNFGTSYSVPLLVKNINPWGNTNLDIQAEESKSFDLGFDYKNLTFTYFYMKVDNLIDWFDPTPTDYFNNDAIYKNLDGTSTFKGIEISLKKDLTNNLLTTLNYSYLDAKDADGKRLERRARQSLKMAFDYYGINKLHLNLNGEYIGDREQTDYTVGKVQTGKYTLWNAVLNYDINKDYKVYFKLDNIFDKYYQTVYEYATAPRSGYVGLKATF